MKKLAFSLMVAFSSTNALAVELKPDHFASDTRPCGIAAVQFKANVEIRLFGNNVHGSPPEVVEKVMLGAVEITLSGQDHLLTNSKKPVGSLPT